MNRSNFLATSAAVAAAASAAPVSALAKSAPIVTPAPLVLPGTAAPAVWAIGQAQIDKWLVDATALGYRVRERTTPTAERMADKFWREVNLCAECDTQVPVLPPEYLDGTDVPKSLDQDLRWSMAGGAHLPWLALLAGECDSVQWVANGWTIAIGQDPYKYWCPAHFEAGVAWAVAWWQEHVARCVEQDTPIDDGEFTRWAVDSEIHHTSKHQRIPEIDAWFAELKSRIDREAHVSESLATPPTETHLERRRVHADWRVRAAAEHDRVEPIIKAELDRRGVTWPDEKSYYVHHSNFAFWGRHEGSWWTVYGVWATIPEDFVAPEGWLRDGSHIAIPAEIEPEPNSYSNEE